VALVDMHFGSTPSVAIGPQVIKSLAAAYPQMEIVGISGDTNLELMEKCLEMGASKYLAKPFRAEDLVHLLSKMESLWSLREAVSKPTPGSTLSWIGISPAAEKVRQEIAALRGEDGPILIFGETGTGKEVACTLLNQQETQRPMISVNVAAIADSLFESEFIRHVKGAFTGADNHKTGLLEACHGGDLFLDEIEALPLHHQAKLLRFLESGEVRKVGGKDIIYVNCRVLAASNEDLQDKAKKGLFREDLFFRLNGKRIHLPPLRERREDVEPLGNFFLSDKTGKPTKTFVLEAIELMQSYPWPGNVRELKRICEQASLRSPLPTIRAKDIHPWLSSANSTAFETTTFFDFSRGLNSLIEETERNIISQCLKMTKDVEKAAEILQISRSNLYKKIKDYGIEENS